MSDLEFRLKDVWIGSYKLFISPARFVNDPVEKKSADKVWQPVRNVQEEDGTETELEKDKGKAVDQHVNVVGVGVPEINIDGDIGAFGEFYDCGLVVTVKGYTELISLRSLLKAMFQHSIQIHYVGGFTVLLVFRDKVERDSFLEDNVGWEVFLDSCVTWNGQILDVERIAWLKLHGVPLTLAKPQVFDVIASNFGKVIHSAQFEEEGRDLSYAVVGVLVNKVERIKQSCVIKWHKIKCNVLVEEEEAGWIPDCIVDLEEEVDCDVVMETPVVDKEKNNGTEEGEIVMEDQGINEGGRGGLEGSPVVTQQMYVHEESNSQLAEGSR
ncbi:hypothetical protein HanRHA438_Chr08g0347431 [Helianthus annuus]|uniref:DUF4283 domain-containing protein n=1 Tax=Helianthus annuus TaxID=4232 RepID=A0A9K3NCD1_HELAN|nr:hypothetical protein HanXRQr2_Chr08g0336051 [Helianthus annuus]KAJ0546603.1 hypothetical protein HanIR_Chr08g0362811 [Helianthus annuus]KAJ0722213.1 hypothetical protein HanOQP8_Chr08g0284141 [Helianthus annuus]KAJ0897596.1 hypothetical protein HanRHA438_Chr08g0347431 [Helianthus annuus]KAJ0901387.1 hypothetical protein HanPSC8_Chr08g0324761 [Helianthus annuus]